MNLKSIEPRPEPRSVEPVIIFDVVFSLPRGKEVPVGFALTVRSEDEMLLGVARPSTTPIKHSPGDVLPLEAECASDNPWELVMSAVLPLTPRVLDFIHDVRERNKKRDVVLRCDVEATWLTSRATIAPLKPSSQQAVMYAEPPTGQRFYSQASNMWVLSGEGGRTFLERWKLFHPQPVTIKSSDWVSDYLTPWNSTRYVVVELPQPEVLSGAAPNVEERVNAAITSIRHAALNVDKGEWNDVLEDLRPVWELLRNDSDVQGLLTRDSYTPEAVAAFNESVKQQFALASKFVHRTDSKGQTVSGEIRASKEDALMCYSFAMALVNLVARKALRLRNSTNP